MELQGFMERQKIPSYFLNVTKLINSVLLKPNFFFSWILALLGSLALLASLGLISLIGLICPIGLISSIGLISPIRPIRPISFAILGPLLGHFLLRSFSCPPFSCPCLLPPSSSLFRRNLRLTLVSILRQA